MGRRIVSCEFFVSLLALLPFADVWLARSKRNSGGDEVLRVTNLCWSVVWSSFHLHTVYTVFVFRLHYVLPAEESL